MTEKGQTLIELVISIGLILIIITGVTTLTIKGLQNSQFSRNQVQATKFAQEGIEKMRTIRDNNFTICGSSNQANTVMTAGLWGTSCPSPGCRYLLNEAIGSCNGTATTSPWLNFTASTTLTEDIIGQTGGTKFTRIVTVADGKDLGNNNNPNVKDVTVTVFWTDSSGSHNSAISTVLTKI